MCGLKFAVKKEKRLYFPTVKPSRNLSISRKIVSHRTLKHQAPIKKFLEIDNLKDCSYLNVSAYVMDFAGVGMKVKTLRAL